MREIEQMSHTELVERLNGYQSGIKVEDLLPELLRRLSRLDVLEQQFDRYEAALKMTPREVSKYLTIRGYHQMEPAPRMHFCLKCVDIAAVEAVLDILHGLVAPPPEPLHDD